jgi:hypothetical protein
MEVTNREWHAGASTSGGPALPEFSSAAEDRLAQVKDATASSRRCEDKLGHMIHEDEWQEVDYSRTTGHPKFGIDWWSAAPR